MKGKRVDIRYKKSNPGKTPLEQSVVEHIMLSPRHRLSPLRLGRRPLRDTIER